MKPWETFVVVQPGLEEIAADEFVSLGIKRPTPELGGFNWVTHPKKLFQIIPYLRIPTRVLIRVGNLHARSFYIFEKEFRKIDFSAFVYNQKINVKVECHHCALYHKGAIAERIENMLNEDRSIDPNVPEQTIHCLGQDNYFTLSVDTCGDHLHKRGLLQKRGPAPLRESIAAAMVRSMNPQGDVWDPFCGSGTILMESLLYQKPQSMIKYRSFSFTNWPIYVTSKPDSLNLEPSKHDLTLIGSDLEEEAIKICQDNLSPVKEQANIQIEQKDFYDADLNDYNLNQPCIIFNPPYGERMPFRELKNQLDQWRSDHPNVRIAVLLPTSKSLPGAKTLFKVKNGGLNVIAQCIEP